MDPNSIEAYMKIQPQLQEKEKIVLKTILANEPVEAKYVSLISGMPINAVVGRINSLCKKNVIEIKHKRKSPLSGMKCNFYGKYTGNR